jgi:hypothetical protein
VADDVAVEAEEAREWLGAVGGVVDEEDRGHWFAKGDRLSGLGRA